MRRNSLKHNILFVSVISAFILYGSTNGNHVVNKDINNQNIKNNYINNYKGSDVNEVLKQMRKQYIVKVKPKTEIPKEKHLFTITSYDLSPQSCSKSRSDIGFGITKNGTNLKNKSWKNIKIISADPLIIPLNSKVKLTFIDPKYKKYSNVIYRCADTGSAIIGNRIDLFIEDGNGKVSQDVINFGVTQAYVEIIKEKKHISAIYIL